MEYYYKDFHKFLEKHREKAIALAVENHWQPGGSFEHHKSISSEHNHIHPKLHHLPSSHHTHVHHS